MTPTWVPNCTQMVRKWAPKGSKIAPWSPPGGRWRPWGALGGPRQIFEGFLVPCWGPFGLPKSSKNWSKIKLKSSIAWDPHFGGSGSPRDQFLEPFLGSFWVLFWPPRRGAGICGKPGFLMKVQHLLLFFPVPGGRTSTKNGSGNSIQQEPGSKSVLGGSRERFWSHLGVIWVPKTVRKRIRQ